MRLPDSNSMFAIWHGCRCALVRFSRNRDGKISFVAIPWILGTIYLIGLVGNVGQTVTEKVEVQNAADSAAFSTALWQARGMNALTTTNHLMGEFTALVVIHESLGGPELDANTGGFGDAQSGNIQTDEDDERQDFIQQAKDDDSAPHIGSSDSTNLAAATVGRLNTFSWYGEIDKPIVDEIEDLILDTDMISGATIYDARLMLKSCTCLLLWVKQQANTAAIVGTIIKQIPIISPIGVAIEAAAFGVHVAATLELIVVAKEWIVLTVHEKGAQIAVPAKYVIRKTVIKALSKYGDLVAGQNLVGSKGLSPVNIAVNSTISDLKNGNRVDELVVFPQPLAISKNLLKLPVTKEDDPSNESSEKPQSQWSGEDPIRGAMSPILELVSGMEGLFGKFKNILRFTKALADFLELDDDIPALSALGPLPPMPKFHIKNWPDNPSWTDSLPEFDVEGERISQFHRATYPYVHAFRGPIRGAWMEGEPWSLTGMPTSLAAEYYAHWTNRYSVTESNRMRKSNFHMYVLSDSKPKTKGNEGWVTDDRRAETLFTVMAFARRTRRAPSLFPQLFTEANQIDTVALSQAMIYNANGRELSGDTQRQPNMGWDTLNWEPRVEAPEWVDLNPGEEDGKIIFNVMAGRSPVSSRSTRVKLNWQAKLVPLTRTRFNDAMQEKMSAGLQKPLKTVKDHFSTVTH